jgi:hypothetical protein
MKNHVYASVFVFLLFSFKGNGQNTDAISKNNPTNLESNFVFSGDYNDLLTLEMASKIAGFDASKASKLHTMRGMMAETLRYYWENGREEVIKESASKRERVAYARTDLVQIKWVDGEADMESFLDFINLEKYPELIKVNDLGESAYWNSKKNHLEVYYNGISFTLQVDISNDESVDKEKTIALAKQILEEKMK